MQDINSPDTQGGGDSNLPIVNLNFPRVDDYNPNSDSLAEQLTKLNSLCSAMANAMLTMNQQLAECRQQIHFLSQATIRDPSQDLARIFAERDARDQSQAQFEKLIQICQNAASSESNKEIIELVRKIKPTLKIVQTQLKNSELRDARIENLYLRAKIPFNFQPVHPFEATDVD